MRRAASVAFAAAVLVLSSCSSGGDPHRRAGAPSSSAAPPSPSSSPSSSIPPPDPNLAPGSDPTVLPGPVLVADHLNNRLVIIDPYGRITWSFPGPGDLAPGQSFDVPDDAFFTPDGKEILATQEDDQVISLIDVATHHIVWRYGTPGVPGSGPNQLHNPDDALMMPNGDVITADIKNCRILVLRPPLQVPVQVYGETTSDCEHDPPQRWGSPNGAFPMADGSYVVTEINGSWVDGLTLGGQVTFSTHPPGVSYPSDTNQAGPGVLLTTDYSTPGQVEEFTPTGQLLWRYQPDGANAMNKPSLALPLPNGDVLVNDDFNHRVVVIDPRTNQVVWQYGHTGVAGSTPGYLNDPDGVDLAPPHSFTITRSKSMGTLQPPASSPGPSAG